MIIRIELSPDGPGWKAVYTVPNNPGLVLPDRSLGRVGQFPAPPRPAQGHTDPNPPTAAPGAFVDSVWAGGAAATTLLDNTYDKVTTRTLRDTVPLGWYLYLTLLGETAGAAIRKFLTDTQAMLTRVELQ